MPQYLHAQFTIPEQNLLDSGFTSIDKALQTPKRVLALDLSGENLTKINLNINVFENLRSLKINNSNISDLSESILQNKLLKSFTFSNIISLYPSDKVHIA